MFTRNRPQREPPEERRGVLGADGGKRESWIHRAVQELKQISDADRVGVWLEEAPGRQTNTGPVVFRGEVWDREESGLPEEWDLLSAEVPLPSEVLRGERSVETETGREGPEMVAGPSVDLERVLWVPVTGRQMLRGLILLGAREKTGRRLPNALAEQVAAELELLLELEEERRRAQERLADLRLQRLVRGALIGEQELEDIFLLLAESCTGKREAARVGAIFALIGQRKRGQPVTRPDEARREERLEIVGHSGDPVWAHSLQEGVLETLWRQALELGRVVGGEAEHLPLAKDISRIVAIPLESKGEDLGVLVAGIPKERTSLDVLERLEWRAMLAAQLLEEKGRREEAVRTGLWKRALLELSEQALLLVDRQGFVRGISVGAQKLLRATGGEARCAELFRSKDWKKVDQWVKASFAASGEKAPESLEVELRSGKPCALRKVTKSGDEFLALRVEEFRQESAPRDVGQVEGELHQTLERLTEGVILFDEEGVVRVLNARVRKMLGLGEEEHFESHGLEELIHRVKKNAADPETFAAGWRETANETEEDTREELAMEWPVPQVIERSSWAIVGQDGKKRGRVEVYRELTAQRIFQSRMVQTEKLASLGLRATSILHEMSNPLTTILGTAQRMVLRAAPGKESAEAQRILEEAERATTILRQLLQFSRTSQPARQVVSLNELVERTVDLQRMAMSGGNIRLCVETDQSEPVVAGDFAQLQQVLLNLLQNAQQAIEQSRRGSTIGVRTRSRPEGRAQIEVWDDGPGVPASIQTRIFDPFFTTKEAGVGTGLGLAVVLGFVRQHGGTVTLFNPAQGGSRFLVELPVAERESSRMAGAEEGLLTRPPKHSESLTVTLEQAVSTGAAHVLVVEDEPTVAALIADVLRDEGMQVDVLLDSRAALQRAEQISYDLLICDLKMPGMDGQMLFRALSQRQNPLYKRVLFVTGDILAPRSQEFLERHHLPHVAKPFRMGELSRAVHETLHDGKILPESVQEATNHAAGNG